MRHSLVIGIQGSFRAAFFCEIDFKVYCEKQGGKVVAPYRMNEMLQDEDAEMSDKEILEQAMTLNPEARLRIVEGLLKSLDKPDWTIDEIWAEEAEKRLTAFRQGRLKGISMEDVFRD